MFLDGVFVGIVGDFVDQFGDQVVGQVCGELGVQCFGGVVWYFEVGYVFDLVYLVQVVWQYVGGEVVFVQVLQCLQGVVDFVQQYCLVEQGGVGVVQVGYCCVYGGVEFVGMVGMDYKCYWLGQGGDLLYQGVVYLFGQYYWQLVVDVQMVQVWNLCQGLGQFFQFVGGQ